MRGKPEFGLGHSDGVFLPFHFSDRLNAETAVEIERSRSVPATGSLRE